MSSAYQQTRASARWVVVLLCFMTVSSAHPTREFHIIREKVLSFDMDVQPIGPFTSTPYEAKSGLIWQQRVVHPTEVGAIRLHVRILRADTQANWQLSFNDLKGNEVDSIGSNSDATLLARSIRLGEYWSAEIRGKGGIVELRAGSDPAGLEIALERYAFRVFRAFPQAITGKDDRIPIWSPLVSPDVKRWGRPVARLRFMVSGGGQALCTGFLVSEDLLITNEHCIKNESELLSAVAEFGYDTYGSLPDRFRAKALELTDAGLDYSVIRLASSPVNKYGKLSVDLKEPLPESLALVVIEHPAGEPKQVSLTDCQVSGSRRQGVAGKPTDFGHLCDTLGGSSGSPVLDLSTGSVVGLHHLGFNENSPDPVNQAVYLESIFKDIQQRNPRLFQEITQRTQ